MDRYVFAVATVNSGANLIITSSVEIPVDRGATCRAGEGPDVERRGLPVATPVTMFWGAFLPPLKGGCMSVFAGMPTETRRVFAREIKKNMWR